MMVSGRQACEPVRLPAHIAGADVAEFPPGVNRLGSG